MLLMNSNNNILTPIDSLFIQYNLCDNYKSLHNTNKYIKYLNLLNFDICQNFQ